MDKEKPIDAKHYLMQVEKLNKQIANKLIEREQWRSMALGITVTADGERVSASGSHSKLEDAVIKCVDMESEIDALVDKLVETKKEVIATIEQLRSPTQYDILHKRYIQFIDLKDIAYKLKCGYTSVTTSHGRALKNVQRILDKRWKQL